LCRRERGGSHMKTYRCYFHGREIGAIGIFHACYVEVRAEDSQSACVKCYDTHEHISGWRAVEIPECDTTREGR
jgi:hypothetical protein